MSDWPSWRRAKDLAGTVFPVGEATILEHARRHGIGRKFGRCVIFSPADCLRLAEALPCPSRSSAAQKAPTGSSVAPSGASVLKKALERATAEQPRKSGRSARRT